MKKRTSIESTQDEYKTIVFQFSLADLLHSIVIAACCMAVIMTIRHKYSVPVSVSCFSGIVIVTTIVGFLRWRFLGSIIGAVLGGIVGTLLQLAWLTYALLM